MMHNVHNSLLMIPFFNDLKKLIIDGGYDAYFVGGCVRDIILNREIQDIDLVCFSHEYKEFASSVKHHIPSVWVEFKDNIRLIRGKTEIDISKPRGAILSQDLSERDFTINNLAMDTGGNIYGDRTDLDAGIIRHIGSDTFRDDPLRMLRAFRFMAQLGFDIAGETLDKIYTERGLLELSASERIYGELDKLFKGSHACEALKLMEEYGVFRIITGGVSTDCYDEKASCAGRGLLFFAASLFCRLEKPEKDKLAERLNFPNAMKKRAERTARFTRTLCELFKNGSDTDIRKLIYKYPEELEDGIKLYRIKSECDGVSFQEIDDNEYRIMSQVSHVDFDLPERLNGQLLQEIGISPGPKMGEVIKAVRPMMAAGELSSLDEVAEYIKNNF